DKHFDHPLDRINPLLLLSIFMALILNLLRGSTRRACNFALRMLKLIIECAIQQKGAVSSDDQEILKRFPTDIRSVRKLFDLDPVTIVWAVCPTCSSTYEPSYQSGIPVYP
ncbi:uncharacterized protein LAESUDRAFT_619922, partial [Laetiporus sulphureus 93-53]